MRLSLSYLTNFIEIPHNASKIINDLTINGLEVEGIYYPYRDIDNKIVIVEIVSVTPHPSNSEWRTVQINNGKEIVSVVCGAKNVRAGVKGVWAPPGSKVYGYEIKEKNFGGLKSLGMLLSLEELGLEDKSDGIWLFSTSMPAGTSLTEILDKDSIVIEINITPNRGDALSYLGIARELSAYYDIDFNFPPSDYFTAGKKENIEIDIRNIKACPLYQGTFAENIKIRESDLFIQKLLIESGLRPINNVVDLSNFVMLETGHPNHTFDFEYIKNGKIVVRNAKDGEKIKLLNGTEITLSSEDLLICDEYSPVALAGVMGGEYSSISTSTTSILLECAVFEPEVIRLTTTKHNINSDSSYRFARGVDPDTVNYATKRFFHLLKRELPEAVVYESITVKNPDLDRKKRINLRYSKFKKVLGKDIDKRFIHSVFKRLGLIILSDNPDSCDIELPAHRYDISTEEDIIEEIARIYGYNKFSATLPHTEIFETNLNVRDRFLRLVAGFLSGLGINEVINFTFIADDVNSIFSNKDPITIRNPISSDMSSMRKSLIPSLLQTATININRQNKDVRIFEIGKIYFKDAEIVERENLGILLSGKAFDRTWANPQREFDFFDIKGIVVNLLRKTGIKEYSFVRKDIPNFMHPGKTARILIDEKDCGLLGEIHPSILKKFDIKQNILIAEIDLEIIFDLYSKYSPSFIRFSQFPAIDRDIAIVLSKNIMSVEVINEIRNMNLEIVEDISVFDLYEGKGIEEGKKSLGISIRYRSNETTLKDEEVEKVHMKIIDNLLKKFYARLR